MPKFDIDITRVSAGFATLTVEAATQIEAEDLALDQAGDHLYNEKSSEYELTHVRSTEEAKGESPIQKLSDAALLDEMNRRGLVGVIWQPSDLVDSDRANNEAQARLILSRVKAKMEGRLTEMGWSIIESVSEKDGLSGDRTEIDVRMDLFGEVLGYSDPLDDSEISVEDVDANMILNRCPALRIDVRYPDESRYGVPAYAIREGATEWLRDHGFTPGEHLHVLSSDSRDDSPPIFTVTLDVPVEALRDRERAQAVEVQPPQRSRTG